MNPEQDLLYRIHQAQAQHRGQSALAYAEFCRRLRQTSENDLTTLLLPPAEAQLPIKTTAKPRFSLGQLCITPNAASAVPADEVLEALKRHALGDWGTLDEHDRQQNEEALRTDGQILSVYESRAGQKFYVITEPGRTHTTVLLPEDY